MIKYVVGFLFDPEMNKVVLIWKNRPEWQRGFLNGVGGKIEKDEEPNFAMKREFEEEAGLEINDWVEFADIKGSDYICHFFYALSHKIYAVSKKTDEELIIADTFAIPELHVIENLKWLIPMCKDKAFKLSGNLLKSTIRYGKENQHISKYHENSAANFLIEEHTIGDIRDQSDFDTIKYHCKKTLIFTKDIISNIDGTNEEKQEFIEKTLEDLNKFKVKKG